MINIKGHSTLVLSASAILHSMLCEDGRDDHHFLGPLGPIGLHSCFTAWRAMNASTAAASSIEVNPMPAGYR
jgi:hypothetical protein